MPKYGNKTWITEERVSVVQVKYGQDTDCIEMGVDLLAFRSIRKRLSVAGSIAVVVALIVAGMAAAATGTIQEIDEFVLAQQSDLRTLDPHNHAERVNHVMDDNIFDPLVRRTPSNELVPWLATGWTVKDPLTWEFTLRKGVRFHNGNPFNAEAVRFSIERLKQGPRGADWQSVESVEVVDDYTVIFHLSRPFPTLLNYLYFAPIVDPVYYSSHDEAHLSLNPVGTGPFKFVEWVKGQRLVLERNDDYWAGPIAIKRLVVRPIPENSTRVNALLTGEVDIATYIPPQMWRLVERAPGVRLDSSAGGRVVSFVFHMESDFAPWKDVRVRQAVNYAINKEAINRLFLDGKGEVVGQAVGSSVFGFNPDIKPYPYDPQKARELLEEAGYGDGFDLVIDVGRGMGLNDIAVAEAVAEQLREVGIRATVNPREWTDMIDAIQNKTGSPMHMLSWGGFSTFDAASYLRPLFTPGATWAFYYSEDVAQGLEEAERAVDPKEREAIYQRLLAQLHEEAVWLYMYVQPNVFGVREQYNWRARPDEMIPLRYVRLGDEDPQEIVQRELDQLQGD